MPSRLSQTAAAARLFRRAAPVRPHPQRAKIRTMRHPFPHTHFVTSRTQIGNREYRRIRPTNDIEASSRPLRTWPTTIETSMRCKNPKCEQVITSAVRQACDEVVAGTASRIGKVAMKTVNQVFVECPICFEVSEYTCHRE